MGSIPRTLPLRFTSEGERRRYDNKTGVCPKWRPSGEPLHEHDGVIRFQHRRKISSILIRNTVVPLAIRTTSGSCLATEGVKSSKTRELL
jgi:hypothetical protein